MNTKQQEVWLIEAEYGEPARVIVYFAGYPLVSTIYLGSGERFERVGLDVYLYTGEKNEGNQN
jgi:hypothetical protein